MYQTAVLITAMTKETSGRLMSVIVQGERIMVLGLISWRGETKLRITELTLSKEIKVISWMLPTTFCLLPIWPEKSRIIFMKDKASDCTDGNFKAWFKDINMAEWPWLSLSSNMNPIGNSWIMLCKQVYGSRRKFCSDTDLVAWVLEKGCNILWMDIISHYMISMPGSCLNVVKATGANTQLQTLLFVQVELTLPVLLIC